MYLCMRLCMYLCIRCLRYNKTTTVVLVVVAERSSWTVCVQQSSWLLAVGSIKGIQPASETPAGHQVQPTPSDWACPTWKCTVMWDTVGKSEDRYGLSRGADCFSRLKYCFTVLLGNCQLSVIKSLLVQLPADTFMMQWAWASCAVVAKQYN